MENIPCVLVKKKTPKTKNKKETLILAQNKIFAAAFNSIKSGFKTNTKCLHYRKPELITSVILMKHG